MDHIPANDSHPQTPWIEEMGPIVAVAAFGLVCFAKVMYSIPDIISWLEYHGWLS